MPREAAEKLVQMVAPVAPHIGEELWRRLGHEQTITYQPFPEADEALLVADTVTCVLQVKGKLRATLDVPADISEADLEQLALAHPKTAEFAPDGVRKVIVKAPKLVNIVPA